MFPDNTKYMIHVGVVSTDNTVNTLKLKFVYLQQGGQNVIHVILSRHNSDANRQFTVFPNKLLKWFNTLVT